MSAELIRSLRENSERFSSTPSISNSSNVIQGNFNRRVTKTLVLPSKLSYINNDVRDKIERIF